MRRLDLPTICRLGTIAIAVYTVSHLILAAQAFANSVASGF